MGDKLSADLSLEIAKAEIKKDKDVQLFNNIVRDFPDPVKMASYKPEQIDMAFNKLVGQQEQQLGMQSGSMDLPSRAKLATNIQREVPVLEKQLSAAANFGGAKQAAQAVQAMKFLQQNNPIVISGLKDKDKAVLDTFGDYISNTTLPPEDAIKAARGDVNVDENIQQERLKAWKEYDKTVYPDLKSKLNHIANGLNAKSGLFNTNDPTLLPSGISVAYDRIMAKTAVHYRDPKMADAAVMDELAKVNQVTYTNNRKEVMAFPPEILYPNQEIFLHSEKVRQLKEYVEQNNDRKANKGFVFNQLEWIDNDENDPSSDIKLKIDGVARKIIISSDLATQYGADGIPSWAFSYLDENNVPYPLMDLNGPGTVKRWSPDFNVQAKKYKEYEKSQREKAKTERDKPVELISQYGFEE
jgi:hypothetical protein